MVRRSAPWSKVPRIPRPTVRPLAPLVEAEKRIAKAKPARDHVVDTVPEWRLQAAIVAELERRGICYAAGLEGVRMSARQAQLAKATGMADGEPDVRVYLSGARLVLVELKTKSGTVRRNQKARHERLRALGFDVFVLKAASEAEAVAGFLAILAPYGVA